MPSWSSSSSSFLLHFFRLVFDRTTSFTHALCTHRTTYKRVWNEQVRYNQTVPFVRPPDHPTIRSENNEISIETKRTNSANKLVVWLSVLFMLSKRLHLFICLYDDDIVASHCMTSHIQVDAKEKIYCSHSFCSGLMFTRVSIMGVCALLHMFVCLVVRAATVRSLPLLLLWVTHVITSQVKSQSSVFMKVPFSLCLSLCSHGFVYARVRFFVLHSING